MLVEPDARDPFARGAVEVRAGWGASLLERLHDEIEHRMLHRYVADVEQTIATGFMSLAMLAFDAPEQRLDFSPGPPGTAQLAPAVIVFGQATHVYKPKRK